MRVIPPAVALGAVIFLSLSGSALVAQDQTQSPTVTNAPTGGQTAPYATPHHAPNPEHQARRMAKKLGLTPDQQAKLEPILAERVQQMQSVRADAALTEQDRHAKMKSIHQDSESRIQAILTDTQKQQYEQMKQERRARHHQQTGENSNATNTNS